MNTLNMKVQDLVLKDEWNEMESLVEKFNYAYDEVKRNVLEMGRVAYLAKQQGKGIYALFCERVFMKESASMSKFVAIGEHYQDWQKHKDCLPSGWTTLYNLTRIPSDNFEEYCESGAIHPNMTGQESLVLIGKAPKKKTNGKTKAYDDQQGNSFVGIGVYISCETPEMAGEIKHLIQRAIETGLTVRPSSDYQLYEEDGIVETEIGG